jgi:small GTP-binding protein
MELKILESVKDMPNSIEVEDYTIKMVIIGDTNVGKSNIISRFVDNKFETNSKTTVGVELSVKTFKICDKVVKVNIWDTAGQERFKSITSAFYKGAKGALIVFDSTNMSSFNSVEKWYNEIREFGDKNIIAILVGNKCDLSEKRQVDKEQGLNLSKNLKIPFLETSAAESTNVELAFKQTINGI